MRQAGVATAVAIAAAVGAMSARMADDRGSSAPRYGLPVRVNFGMEETTNLIVSSRIERDVLQIPVTEPDAGSFRVVDDRGAEVPSVVRADAGGDLFVVWRVPGRTEILDTRNYVIYLDSSATSFGKRATVEPQGHIPRIVPGMNLISNGDFSELDAAGFPKDWVNLDLNSDQKTAWGASDREGVKVVHFDGRRCLRLAGGSFVVHAVTGLTAGATYKASLLGTTDPGATILVTIMYRRANLDWFRNGIGNYKTQYSHARPGGWSLAEAATFVYADRNGNPHYNNRYLLPETETAYVAVENHRAPEGAFVHVTDVRFELAGDNAEAKVIVGDPLEL